MFPLFLALTILSIALLVAGVILLLMHRGRVTYETGPAAGAQVMAGDDLPSPDQLPIAETESTVFVGTGARVRVEGEISLSEAKQAWRAHRRTDALPAILLALGFAGLFLFGALSLLTGLDTRLPGLIALAIAIWVIALLARDLARA